MTDVILTQTDQDIEKLQSDIILLRAEMLALKRDLQFSIDILFSNSNQYIDTAVSFAERLDKLEAIEFDNFTTQLAKDIFVINKRLEKLEAKQ